MNYSELLQLAKGWGNFKFYRGIIWRLLYKKWNRRPQSNWALVRNQLDMDEKIQERIRKYENGGL